MSESGFIKKCIVKILTLAQETHFNEDQGLSDLLLLINKNQNTEQDQLFEFTNEFINCFRICLCSSENFRTNKLIDFIVEFVSDLNKTDDELIVQNEILFFLLRNAKANADLVRYRIFDILARFLDNCTTRTNQAGSGEQGMNLDEKLYLKMQSVFVDGIYDKSMHIQKRALLAAKYFQSPRDKYCPVINSYLKFLRKESLVDIRISVLDYIVINKSSFDLIKNELIFDSSAKFIERLVQKIISKKVPLKHIDAKFNKNLIDALLRIPEAQDLLVQYLESCLSECKCVHALIEYFELENQWYVQEPPMSHSFLVYIDEKLFSVMKIVFKLCTSAEKHRRKLNSIESLIFNAEFNNLNLSKAFYLRTFLKLVNKSFLDESNIDLAVYLNFIELNRENHLLIYQLIDVIEYLDEVALNHQYVVNNLIEIVDSNETFEKNKSVKSPADSEHVDLLDNYFIYELILGKFIEKYDLEYFKYMYKQKKQEVKALKVYSVLFSRLSREDFEQAERKYKQHGNQVNDEEDNLMENLNLVEFIVQNFLMKQISNFNPGVRALSLRCLNQVSMLSFDLAESYIPLFTNVVMLDYPLPVIEAEKSLFNIILFYSNSFDFKTNKTWCNALEILENQIQCLDTNIRYVACHGFAMLFLNNCNFQNKQQILTSLILNYLVDNVNTDKKIISCLFHFFNHFVALEQNGQSNLNMLVKLCVPVIKFSISKCYPIETLRKVAKFFYFISSGFVSGDLESETKSAVQPSQTNNSRLFLINSILDEIFKTKFKDYNLVQRWIEIAIEFNVHQYDICNEDTEDVLFTESIEYLKNVLTKLQEIVLKYKKENWKLNKEVELKLITDRVKSLLNKNSREQKINSVSGRIRSVHLIEDDQSDDNTDDDEPNSKIANVNSNRIIPKMVARIQKNI